MNNDPHGRAAPSPRQALLTLRIIGVSMAFGITLFAFVAWFGGLAGQSGLSEGPGLLFGGLVLFALATLSVAVVLWRVRVAPLLRAGAGDWDTRFPQLQTNVIIVWALLEAPALAAVTVYFLFGDVPSALLGLAVIWVGVGLSWPRADWIEPTR